ncbi:M48 family metallopeptidase [Bacillus sp. ISL-40]|uniref:M48 family metallopeptidase n=1 Tax=unclassified Bacillus (in: firmicutes) TaxID=185979 RepID=UPI001BE9CE8B|nr:MULTISPECIES: M48 family metallopeptidase [unclassified Bacillus (in: firmicutes)]MBT2697062.1 M48 family metallopeptidase [Bacillus sp. ISL-40]MBT2721774.1 M48 family metallopeptidase [Bacillus sp. ISL-46]MBT2740397.1 M48 family metallopeptidase [Bacillus sp. ISL-77]
MARKMGVYAVMGYILYGLFFYWYLFHFTDTNLPFEYEGSKADPTTFLNGRELMLSEEYSKIRNLLFFLSTPFEWLLYFLILLFGFSKAFKRWAENSSKYKLLQTAIYLIWLSVFAYLATFPLSYISFSLSKTYNISTQTFASWMKDELIDFWLNYGTWLIIVPVLYWLMKKSQKRWWLYGWLLSIPFTLFMMFLQPVVIDPLYNDFYPLTNKELETKILALADKADIPAQHVFEVNKSEETNALNAYVTGIGSNARIVLWDTTLNKLTDDQILFIMAHEMCHYVEKHIYFGIAGYLLISLLGLYLTYRIMNWATRRWGKELNISDVRDIRSLPLFFMILSMLLFAASPLTNFTSRYQETRADKYAIEMTKNPEAAITSFQELTRSGLSQVNPPLLVKIFRYTHPSMLDRISMLEDYEVKHRNK